jgi:hypothetical protein
MKLRTVTLVLIAVALIAAAVWYVLVPMASYIVRAVSAALD